MIWITDLAIIIYLITVSRERALQCIARAYGRGYSSLQFIEEIQRLARG